MNDGEENLWWCGEKRGKKERENHQSNGMKDSKRDGARMSEGGVSQMVFLFTVGAY